MTITKKNLPGRHAKFTADFRAEAVRLVHTSGRPLRAIADDLGIGLSTLGKWVKDFAGDPQQAFPGHGQQKPEQAEIARLKREVARLKAERDILNWSRI